MMMMQKTRRRSSATRRFASVAQVEAEHRQQQQADGEPEVAGLMSAQLHERLFGDSANNNNNNKSQLNTRAPTRNFNHQPPVDYERLHSTTTTATTAATTRSSRKMISIRKQLASVRAQTTLASVALALAIAICLSSGHLQPSCVHGAKLPDIYWNSSNPIFRIDNTDHIFDVNKKLHDHDQVDLVCPQAPAAGAEPATNKSGDLVPAERYIIYSVSKDEYDTCRLQPASAARPVAICDQPAAGKPNRPPITITFRSFTPQPNGLEFKPGQDYYFITALHQPAEPARRFAPCREQNMKVIFKICCKGPQSQAPGSTQNPLASMLSNRKPMQVGQQAQPMPARSGVITMRPTFKPVGGFVPTAPAQQPVTVLPIEDIRPPQESNESGAGSSSSNEPTAMPQQDSSTANDIRGDIQNEQPQGQAPAHMPPWVESQPASNSAAHKNPAFIPFDPRTRPDAFGRWAPTPLPPRLLPNPVSQQQQQQQPAPELVQAKQYPWQQEPPLGGQRNSPSRVEFYPWSPIQRDLTAGQPRDQQPAQPANTATSPPTLALALLLPLFALVILLALGLERRLR